MIKTIIFDLDGTLIDSEYRTIKIKRDLLNNYGINTDDEFIKQLVGKKLSRILPTLMPDFPLMSQLLKEYQVLAYTDVDYKKLEMAGATSVLNELKKHYQLALATSSLKAKIQLVLTQLGWENMFDCIVGLDDVDKPKPNPECLTLIMNKLNVYKDEVIVVEDGQSGIDAAKALQLKVICRNEKRYPISQDNADYYIDSLDEITGILNK